MPLELQAPPGAPQESGGPPSVHADPGTVVIGLVNNMPDPALEGTEQQFKGLLAAAAGARTVQLRLASLPGVPRGAQARARIAARYWSVEQLWTQPPDAIIVTGAEPKTAVLSDEPYWQNLVELVERADATLVSSVWSCLAAHAAVLHLDGIARTRLAAKRFGVFEQHVVVDHGLTRDLGPTLSIPHSRWNDLSATSLATAGYRVLTRSAAGDADLFIKQRRSLLVFFQGHPEYEERTLLKEYQRDVGRFISGEYQACPQAPPGYFRPEASRLAGDFERGLRSAGPPDRSAAFPFAALAASIDTAWLAPAAQIYRNWIELIMARKGCPSIATR